MANSSSPTDPSDVPSNANSVHGYGASDEEVRMGRWKDLNRRLSTHRWYTALGRAVITPVDRFLHRVTGGRLTLGETIFPTLMLTTTGRRSGRLRTTPLVYLDDDGAWIVVGTNFGGGSHPGWTWNLLEDPEAEVEVDGRRVPVSAERIDPEEMDRYWPRFDDLYPGYDSYRQRVSREIRMFRLIPRD